MRGLINIIQLTNLGQVTDYQQLYKSNHDITYLEIYLAQLSVGIQ